DALDDALGLRIIEILRETPSISQEVLASELNVTRRTIQRKMDYLKEIKQIERKGGKRFGYWEIHLPEKTD
ncbi:MAG: helix-turn-helix domain-containing protein, partial [Spirochaetales bacterium]|nr:helix-turn-helix domain-containing protein [Spirochaetales bacterium]